MNVVTTDIPDVLLFEPQVYSDSRGRFYQAWKDEDYAAHGLPARWSQDNLVHSVRGVLRGLHFQHPYGQYKLVSVVQGAIFDVAVDVRVGSPTFGRWTGAELSVDNCRQLAIPPWFAHGYLVLSETSTVMYKCSNPWVPVAERAIRWNDPAVGIRWPAEPTLLNARDRDAPLLAELSHDHLPTLKDDSGMNALARARK